MHQIIQSFFSGGIVRTYEVTIVELIEQIQQLWMCKGVLLSVKESAGWKRIITMPNVQNAHFAGKYKWPSGLTKSVESDYEGPKFETRRYDYSRCESEI